MSYGYTRIGEYKDGRIYGSLSSGEEQRAIREFERDHEHHLGDVAVVYIHNDFGRVIAVWVERGYVDETQEEDSPEFNI